MDPFAAISFAGNILQFIEFATKLVKEGKEVYRSADGAVQENIDLELITLDLKQLTKSLTSDSRNPSKDVLHHDKHLAELAAACHTTSNKLLYMLQKLKLPKGTRHLKLKSIQVTLRMSVKGKQIDVLRSRLDSFRNSLNTHVLKQLSHQQSEITKAVTDLCKENRNLRIHTANALDTTRTEIIEEIRQMNKQTGDQDSFMTAVRIAEFGEEGTRVLNSIIQSLHFPTIKVRFEEIKAAHSRTFEWAFNEPKIHLKQWLEAEAGIFWVSGKAGSGKSTWVKFLCRKQETMTALKQWADPKRVIVASYFFWNAGHREQKSQEGLLRSLLFQVLQQAPQLVPTVCPNRWNDASERESVWTLGELSRAFRALAQQSSLPVKLCFFVDGLDEFEPTVENGDHRELLQILKNVSISPDIKLCLSSRPWPFVLSELSQSNRKIFMQDLTINDMQTYVRDTLESNEDFQSLQMREPECVSLIAQITAKAQGVFLWVYLVVRSLAKGLESEDTAAELQERIDALPEGLENLFERSIRSIEPAYQPQSAKILQFAITAHAPLNILAYHFLDVEMQNSNYAMEDINLLEDHKDLYERMRRRLHARSKDLLEVSPLRDSNTCRNISVNFLHRTVKEFLEGSPDVAAMLRTRTPGFDPRISICNSFLAQIKTLPKASTSRHYFRLVDDLLYYTREVETHNHVAQVDVLDEVDRHLRQREEHIQYHWTNSRTIGQRGVPDENGKCDFLGLAIQTRQRLYVEQKLSEDCSLLGSKTGRPYLDYALRPTLMTISDLPVTCEFADPSTVSMLLKLGADPNLSSESQKNLTPWALFLMYCEQEQEGFRATTDVEEPRLDVDSLVEVIDLLLKHGADPTLEYSVLVTSNGTTMKKKQSVVRVLRKILSRENVRLLLGATKKHEILSPHPTPPLRPLSPPPPRGFDLTVVKLRKLLCLG